MDKRKIIEWHPAFEASIQIEFENEIEKMTFEPENIGTFFRRDLITS